jgi:phosphoribosylamine--glycine ligase
VAKVLIIGSGGREHSLGWKLAQSPQVEKVYFAPGNGGTLQVGENVDIAANDYQGLLEFAQRKKIDLTVVGPDQQLADGIVDLFEPEGLKIFGPNKAAAQIESSKVFSTDFMERHNIPHPKSTIASSLEQAQEFIKTNPVESYVIKADGLAAGKGVIVPENQAEAEAAISDIMDKKIFGEAGSKIVFQERLRGQEVSTFCLSDGENILMLPFFQDHKQVYDGDKGPNTGGMGAYTPLPFMTEELESQIEDKIMAMAINGMKSDGTPYKGVLYGGLFVTDQGEAKVIEFNSRFGDPECQPMMMAIDEDLYSLLLQCAEGELKQSEAKVKPGSVVTVILVSGGYPGKYETGIPIEGLDKVDDPDVVVFHAGTKMEEGKPVTSGGRVLNVTATGPDIQSALAKAYAQIGLDKIHFKDMHYRKDIAHRILKK